MNNAIADAVYSNLEGGPLQRMARQLGIGPAQMAGAVSAALPLLVGALGRNASEPTGAETLFGALQRDHLGADIERVLGAALDNATDPTPGEGARILGHVFGGRQPRAEQALGIATGLGDERAGMLLRMLAPVVLAVLAKRVFVPRHASAGDPTPETLGHVLGQEQKRCRQQGGLCGGVIGAVLDQDGDGQVGIADLLQVAGTYVGGGGRA